MVTDLTLPVMFTLIHERNCASVTGGSFETYPVDTSMLNMVFNLVRFEVHVKEDFFIIIIIIIDNAR